MMLGTQGSAPLVSPANVFQATAEIVRFAPYLGEPLAAALQAIAALYQHNKECRTLCEKLLVALQHFAEKIGRVRSCLVGTNTSSDTRWLLDCLTKFEGLIQRVKTDLDAYSGAVQATGAAKLLGAGSFMAALKYKTKFNKHREDMVGINCQLDDAIRDFTMLTVKSMADRMNSFHSFGVAPQQVPVPSAQDALVVRETYQSTQTLMAEVDTNHDGYITADELWNVRDIQVLFVNKDALHKMICSLFDRDSDGRLDFEETIMLTAALHQLSKLFYAIPQRCPDRDYIPAAAAVKTLQALGYNSIAELDVLQAADQKPDLFRWCMETHELQMSYEGFLSFYLRTLDHRNLWDHARSRIGAPPAA